MIVVLLHFLGGSAREWDEVLARAGTGLRAVAIDLPGFGDASAVPGYGVADMADHVAHRVERLAPDGWVAVGHSMGAKVAAVLARRAEDGEPGLRGLRHLVTIAGSPPGPEPIGDEKRAAMRSWFHGDATASAAEASAYIDHNVGSPLPAEVKRGAVVDVLRMNRAAWTAWLDGGSREDWAARIGVLRTPATVVAGEQDAGLGLDAQQRLMLPHVPDARVVQLAGAGHLMPMERPDEVARLLMEAAA